MKPSQENLKTIKYLTQEAVSRLFAKIHDKRDRGGCNQRKFEQVISGDFLKNFRQSCRKQLMIGLQLSINFPTYPNNNFRQRLDVFQVGPKIHNAGPQNVFSRNHCV